MYWAILGRWLAKRSESGPKRLDNDDGVLFRSAPRLTILIKVNVHDHRQVPLLHQGSLMDITKRRPALESTNHFFSG